MRTQRYDLMMLDRRYFLAGTAGAFLNILPSRASAAGMTRVTAYAFQFKGLDGADILLSAFTGRPILVVNTASFCGYTPQYAGLQELWMRYRAKGLMLLGVPSNDFGGQEPGGREEIGKTAHGVYDVTFPITEKVAVKGAKAHPFYKWAAQKRSHQKRRAGISINTLSDATVICARHSAPPWSQPTRVLSRQSSWKLLDHKHDRGAQVTQPPRSSDTGQITIDESVCEAPARVQVKTRGPAALERPTRLRSSSRVASKLGGRKAAHFS